MITAQEANIIMMKNRNQNCSDQIDTLCLGIEYAIQKNKSFVKKEGNKENKDIITVLKYFEYYGYAISYDNKSNIYVIKWEE